MAHPFPWDLDEPVCGLISEAKPLTYVKDVEEPHKAHVRCLIYPSPYPVGGHLEKDRQFQVHHYTTGGY